MKKIISILFVIDVIGFIIGFVLVNSNPNKGHQIIGVSLLFLMFLIIPLFLFMRYSKKQASDFVYKKDNEN
jgi:Kef-type K+ transport system membrane component KefB